MESAFAAFDGMGGPEMIIASAIFVAFVFHINVLLHAINNKALSFWAKVCWIIIVVAVPVVGPVIYLVYKRK